MSGGESQELATDDGKREPTTCACCRGILEEGEADTCHECAGRYCDCCGEKLLDDEDTEVCSVCDDEVCGGCIVSGRCSTCLINDDDLWDDDEDDDLEDDGDLDDSDEDFDDDDF